MTRANELSLFQLGDGLSGLYFGDAGISGFGLGFLETAVPDYLGHLIRLAKES